MLPPAITDDTVNDNEKAIPLCDIESLALKYDFFRQSGGGLDRAGVNHVLWQFIQQFYGGRISLKEWRGTARQTKRSTREKCVHHTTHKKLCSRCN